MLNSRGCTHVTASEALEDAYRGDGPITQNDNERPVLGRPDDRPMNLHFAHPHVCNLPLTIDLLTERLSNLLSDEAIAADHVADPITIGNRTWSHEDAPIVLASNLHAIPRVIREPVRVPLGIYRGLRFGLVLQPDSPAQVYLDGAAARQLPLSVERLGSSDILYVLERLASTYSVVCARVRQQLAMAESQLRESIKGGSLLHDDSAV